jgi:hypothetical protein
LAGDRIRRDLVEDERPAIHLEAHRCPDAHLPILLLAFARAASAHRLDAYPQATLASVSH